MVKIDEDRCVGCGICVNICPQGFKMVNRKAKIKNENASCIIETANSCPQGAIILEENKNQEEPSTRQTFRPNFINNIGNSFGGKGRNSGIGRSFNPGGHRGNRGRGKGRR